MRKIILLIILISATSLLASAQTQAKWSVSLNGSTRTYKTEYVEVSVDGEKLQIFINIPGMRNAKEKITAVFKEDKLVFKAKTASAVWRGENIALEDDTVILYAVSQQLNSLPDERIQNLVTQAVLASSTQPDS